MARTTLLLEDDLLLDLKRLAALRGGTMTDVVHEALRAYVATQPRPGLPSFTGIVSNARARNVGRDAKKIVRRIVDPFEGRSRERRRRGDHR